MKLLSSDKKTFELKDGPKILGRIVYEGIFSFKATAELGREHYKITPVGIFSTTISISRRGQEIATMKMNWKGHIVISFSQGQEYILRTTGTLHDKYVLEDQNQTRVIHLDPEFNWKRFNYNYAVSHNSKELDVLLVLFTAYAANYHVAAMSSTVY